MIKKKVCMLGAFAVGKTSLVQRFVYSMFSDKYKTTLGVKIDKKELLVDDTSVELILWDLAGEDEFMKVRESYLRGSAGFLLVADGTRRETVAIAEQLYDKMLDVVGDVPFVMLLNKSDLEEQWQVDEQQLDQLRAKGWEVTTTSALNNDNVESVFESLARKLVAGS